MIALSKSQLLVIAIVGLGVFVAYGAAETEEVQKGDSDTSVALVDVAKVFKHCDEFNIKMEDIKRRIIDFEKHVREESLRIGPFLPKNEIVPPAEIERQAIDRRADIAAEIAAKRAEFLRQEAEVYHEIYGKIESVVGELAHEKGIDLVLRFNSEKLNPQDRQSVLQGVNRAVIFSATPDLTSEVLAKLNQK